MMNFNSLTSRIRATKWADGSLSMEVALRTTSMDREYFRIDGASHDLILGTVPAGDAGWTAWADVVSVDGAPQAVTRFVSKVGVYLNIDPNHENTLVVTGAKIASATPTKVSAALDGVTLGSKPVPRAKPAAQPAQPAQDPIM